ncbi:MAG: hypothetical protein C0601_03925 [Candidatus Muiribacterium halophilum]|uniref:POTRA domain-containing protein n=1 Tax=Muiribacterium halophilum TaxID=2053465 RepID=A0A2N5ZJD3_MUIH1|nr:MAG: hypothetical protein C0601_03925 [Candidatus Muirbacterium halophilum]
MENRILKRIFFLFIIFLTLNAYSYSNIITAIEFKGNNRFSSEELLMKIASRVGSSFEAEILQSDINRLYNSGNFTDVGADTQQQSGGVKIIFKLIENKKIRSIQIIGNNILSDNQILYIIKSKVNNVFNFNTLKDDMKLIEKYYASKGYTLVSVDDVEVSEDGSKIKLSIKEPKVEALLVKGSQSTKASFIKRKIGIEKGDFYNFNTLVSGVDSIKKMGIFKNIRFFIKDGTIPGYIRIEIEIQEKKTGELAFGINYGSYDGFVGSISLEKKNFRGRGDNLKFEIELGEVSNYEFTFEHPYFLQSEYTMDVKLYDYSIDREKYDNNGIKLYDFQEEKDGLGLGFKKKSKSFEHEYRYTSENITVKAGNASAGEKKSWLEYIVSQKQKNGKAYLSFSKTGGFLSGKTSYYKYKFWKTLIYKQNRQETGIRLMTEYIDLDENQLGEYEKASVGGGDTLRGYKSSNFTSNEYILINLEERLKVNERLWYIIFSDIALINDDFRKTVGVGFAIDSPIGIIRIDYGKPFNDDDHDTGRLYLGLGFMF